MNIFQPSLAFVGSFSDYYLRAALRPCMSTGSIIYLFLSDFCLVLLWESGRET